MAETAECLSVHLFTSIPPARHSSRRQPCKSAILPEASLWGLTLSRWQREPDNRGKTALGWHALRAREEVPGRKSSDGGGGVLFSYEVVRKGLLEEATLSRNKRK